jgi:hypothetical protein
MTTQIEIQPETADKLFSIAEKQGVSVDTLLLRQILKPFDKSDETAQNWQLAGSMELLDDDLETASRQINQMLQKSILKTSRFEKLTCFHIPEFDGFVCASRSE